MEVYDELKEYIKAEHHEIAQDHFGIGFDPSVDWFRFTIENRIVKDAGPYKDIAHQWQLMLDYSLMTFPRVYHQLARGHDKTERESWWALVWGLTADHGQVFCCGADRDNAQLFRNAAKWQVEQHEFFRDYSVHNYDIINRKTGAHIKILASDASTNFGLTPDLLMFTDFHSWSDAEYFNALFTSTGKRPNSRVWIESNALDIGTPQYQWIKPIRDLAKHEHNKWQGKPPGPTSRRWFFYAPPTFLATWQINSLEEWHGTIPPPAFKRLILNQDTSGATAFVTEEQVEACETSKGPSLPLKGSRTVVATDIGLTTDATAIYSVSSYYKEVKGKSEIFYDVNQADIMVGSRDDPVNLRAAVAIADKFANDASRAGSAVTKICDPYEMRGLMQEDSSWQEFKFTTDNVKKITNILWRAIIQKRIRLWRRCTPAMQGKDGQRKEEWDLKRELIQAVLKTMSYGVRVDHQAGGFSDRLIALGMCLVRLTEDALPGKPRQDKKQIDTRTMGAILDKILADENKPTRLIC